MHIPNWDVITEFRNSDALNYCVTDKCNVITVMLSSVTHYPPSLPKVEKKKKKTLKKKNVPKP